MSQARFQKRMREKAKQDKQRAKRARKEDRAAEAAEAAESGDGGGDGEDAAAPPQPQVLDQLAALHKQFEDDQIDFDEFEERKQELLAQLQV